MYIYYVCIHNICPYIFSGPCNIMRRYTRNNLKKDFIYGIIPTIREYIVQHTIDNLGANLDT